MTTDLYFYYSAMNFELMWSLFTHLICKCHNHDRSLLSPSGLLEQSSDCLHPVLDVQYYHNLSSGNQSWSTAYSILSFLKRTDVFFFSFCPFFKPIRSLGDLVMVAWFVHNSYAWTHSKDEAHQGPYSLCFSKLSRAEECRKCRTVLFASSFKIIFDKYSHF